MMSKIPVYIQLVSLLFPIIGSITVNKAAQAILPVYTVQPPSPATNVSNSLSSSQCSHQVCQYAIRKKLSIGQTLSMAVLSQVFLVILRSNSIYPSNNPDQAATVLGYHLRDSHKGFRFSQTLGCNLVDASEHLVQLCGITGSIVPPKTSYLQNEWGFIRSMEIAEFLAIQKVTHGDSNKPREVHYHLIRFIMEWVNDRALSQELSKITPTALHTHIILPRTWAIFSVNEIQTFLVRAKSFMTYFHTFFRYSATPGASVLHFTVIQIPFVLFANGVPIPPISLPPDQLDTCIFVEPPWKSSLISGDEPNECLVRDSEVAIDEYSRPLNLVQKFSVSPQQPISKYGSKVVASALPFMLVLILILLLLLARARSPTRMRRGSFLPHCRTVKPWGHGSKTRYELQLIRKKLGWAPHHLHEAHRCRGFSIFYLNPDSSAVTCTSPFSVSSLPAAHFDRNDNTQTLLISGASQIEQPIAMVSPGLVAYTLGNVFSSSGSSNLSNVEDPDVHDSGTSPLPPVVFKHHFWSETSPASGFRPRQGSWDQPKKFRPRRLSWEEKKKWVGQGVKGSDNDGIPSYPSTQRLDLLHRPEADNVRHDFNGMMELEEVFYNDSEEEPDQYDWELQQAIVLSLSPDSQKPFVGSSHHADR